MWGGGGRIFGRVLAGGVGVFQPVSSFCLPGFGAMSWVRLAPNVGHGAGAHLELLGALCSEEEIAFHLALPTKKMGRTSVGANFYFQGGIFNVGCSPTIKISPWIRQPAPYKTNPPLQPLLLGGNMFFSGPGRRREATGGAVGKGIWYMTHPYVAKKNAPKMVPTKPPMVATH